MTRTRTLVALVALLLLLALPATVAAQPFSPDIQRIGTSDGADIDAASPLPISGTVGLSAQAGAGAVTATTLRTVTSTDSPDVISLGTLDNVVGATSAATPTSAALIGAVDSVSGNLMPLRVFDADTGAGNDFRLGTVPLLAGAGGGTPASAGAGAVDAGTQRTTLAADDPAVVSLGTLDDVVGAPAAAAPSKGALVMGQFGANTRAITTDDSGRINVNAVTWNGSVLESGAGNSSSSSIRVVQAAISSGTSDHVDVDASEVAVLAAKAGRRFARIQVYADVDGGVCCALGATTNACTDGILLDASPAAGKAGGSAEWEGYGGAITCRAAGAWTTTVATEEW